MNGVFTKMPFFNPSYRAGILNPINLHSEKLPYEVIKNNL